MTRVLVTGSAGFIGSHLAQRFLEEGHEVLGVDGLTPYYDVSLKLARHARLKDHAGFAERILMLEDRAALAGATDSFQPEVIVHLAAQAGVRYSVDNPRAYIDANLVGAFNVLEVARAAKIRHLLLASTSSVYGANREMPFREQDRVFRFVRGIRSGAPIDVYNNGEMERDFTYIDDLVEAVWRLTKVPPELGGAVLGDSMSPAAPWRVVNIGRGEPVRLMDFIAETERALGLRARLNLLPMQPGDVERTFADPALLETLTGYRPSTPIGQGVAAFCRWYEDYYGAAAVS